MSMSDVARAPQPIDTTNTEDRTMGEKAMGALNTAGEMTKGALKSAGEMTFNVLDSTGRMTMDAMATVSGKTKEVLNNAGVLDALSSASETTKGAVSTAGEKTMGALSSASEMTKDALSNAAAKTQELAQQLKGKVVGESCESSGISPEEQAVLDRDIAEQKRKLDLHLFQSSMGMAPQQQEITKCHSNCACPECAYNRKPLQVIH